MWVCGCVGVWVCLCVTYLTDEWVAEIFPSKKAMQITSLSAVKKVFNWACRKLPPLFARF
jgi:hypothetical protein